MSRARAGGAAILLFCLACYANSLSGSFHYDDFHSIVDNPHLRSLANLPRFFAEPAMFSADAEKQMYRPVLLATYAFNYALGGYEVRGYHLFNLLLHIACSLLVWRLGLRLGAGLIPGLIFAAHPLATEPVNYISSRSESLAACFYLGAFLGYLKAEEEPGYGPLSLGCFALGLLSKEVVVTLPAALWLADRMKGRPAHWKRYAPYVLLDAGYLLLITCNHFLTRSLAAPVRGSWTQLWTQAKALAYYLKLLWVPWGLNVEPQFFESSAPTGVVLAGLALALSLALLAWKGRRCLPGFALAWAGVVLLPAAAMPLNMLVNEHRLYLVMAGFAWLCGYLLKVQRRPFLYLWLPLFGILTFERNRVWHSEQRLWEDAVSKAPRMYRAQTNLGKARQLSGDAEGARRAYQAALELDDRHGDAYNNIATLLHLQGHIDEAIAWYWKAIERYPDYEEIYQNLADAYSQKGELDKAIAMYEKALQIDGQRGSTWNNYGQTLYQARRWKEAEQAFLRATELMPEQPEPHNNLGNTYSEQGDFRKAVEQYQQALERHPAQEAEVWLNLADACRQAGELERARQEVDQVLARWPGEPRAYYTLGRIARQAGQAAQALEAFERAVALDPAQVKARVELAEIQAEGGRLAEAVARFREALERDPRHGRAFFGLAQALERLGQRAEAAGAYRRFLEVWKQPDRRAAEAQERLRRLEAGR